MHKKTTVLMILDGFGYREDPENNAIAQAHTPQWDAWWQTRPHMLLQTTGGVVGLPDGQMGNSEVGHMHIGAGRLILQDLTRINQSIENQDFFKNPVFTRVLDDLQASQKTLHVLGLLSDGGVHAHEQHLFAFLRLCHQRHFSNVALHLFLDGRDTPPQSATTYINRLEAFLKTYPVASIASLSGRYYAMDRDKRWERIATVYRLLVDNQCEQRFATATEALQYYYHQHITDEFIPPCGIGTAQPITAGDAVFFFNYRPDRARQLTQALYDPSVLALDSAQKPALSHFISMTCYDKNLPTDIAFPQHIPRHTLGEVVAQHHLRQLRIAETEKYAHVTFFINGGVEAVFPNEDRILIPSPHVKTYDLQPEMSAKDLTLKLIDAIKSQQYDLIICNFANADMVGHTGNLNACIKAIEQLDQSMHDVWEALQARQGQMLITADHGNAECMFDPENQQAHTAHTTEPVPLLYLGGPYHFYKKTGTLSDIAPTLLMLLGITPPVEMTGNILLVSDHEKKTEE